MGSFPGIPCLAFLIPIFREMNSEEEGGEVGKGGIFSKIHYGDWGGGGWDLWQDPLRGKRCLSFTIGSGILLKNCCLSVFLEI